MKQVGFFIRNCNSGPNVICKGHLTYEIFELVKTYVYINSIPDPSALEILAEEARRRANETSKIFPSGTVTRHR